MVTINTKSIEKHIKERILIGQSEFNIFNREAYYKIVVDFCLEHFHYYNN